MTAEEVAAIVQRELLTIARELDDQQYEWVHQRIIAPRRVCLVGMDHAPILGMWLVFEECVNEPDRGHLILFDEHHREFVSAYKKMGNPCVGVYLASFDSFAEALRMM